MKDYYVALGVSKNAEKSEIKKAYRDSAKKYHPDSADASLDAKRFNEITEAYETLGNKDKRAEYDRNFFKKPQPQSHSFDKSPKPFNPNNFNTEPLFFNQFRNRHFSVPAKSQIKCTVRLTSQDIKRDIQYPCNIKILQPCSRCCRLLSQALFYCPECQGHGYVLKKKELIINIPQNIEHGTRVQLDLSHVGISETVLIVTILVSDYNNTPW